MLGSILPMIISGGAKLIGGFMGQKSAEQQQAQQIALQKEFAKNAIQWKVADAKAAGVHPLYGLGANTVSFQPNLVGADPMGQAFSDMGQDLSRAVEVAQSAPERVYNKAAQALALERAGLENDLLRSQIARNTLSAQVPPPIPVQETIVPAQRTPAVRVGGADIELDPTTSNLGQLAEDRYGEGPASWVTGAAALVNDVMFNLKNKGFLELLRDLDRATSINKYGYK